MKLTVKYFMKYLHEIVGHSVKHLAFLYGERVPLEEIREITEKGSGQSGESLSLAVKRMREEGL